MEQRYTFDDRRFLSRELDGETMILNIESSDYFTLNETAGRIFRWLSEGAPVAEVESRFAAAYSLDGASARRDVADLISQLRKKKILQAAAQGK